MAAVYRTILRHPLKWLAAGWPRPAPVSTCDRSRSNLPCWQGGIAVIDDDSEGDALELEHRGDEADGMSGGPLFGIWKENGRDLPYVIGTHSGTETEFPDYTWHSLAEGGGALVNLIRWAHQNW